jgi:hypothetical protein
MSRVGFGKTVYSLERARGKTGCVIERRFYFTFVPYSIPCILFNCIIIIIFLLRPGNPRKVASAPRVLRTAAVVVFAALCPSDGFLSDSRPKTEKKKNRIWNTNYKLDPTERDDGER